MKWKEYLSFTKRERNGVIVLALLILFTAIVPEFFPDVKIHPRHSDQGGKDSAEYAAPYSAGRRYDRRRGIDDDRKRMDDHRRRFNDRFSESEYSPADRGSYDSLKSNGYANRVWRPYYARGKNKQEQTPWRYPYRRRYEEEKTIAAKGYGSAAYGKAINGKMKNSSSKAGVGRAPTIIDINIADTNALIALPGIGSKLAARIILFREKLGGFNSVEQLKEVYGLSEPVFALIAGRLLCDSSLIRKININADQPDSPLMQHPYTRGLIAASVIGYRKLHGPFGSPRDLEKIDRIDAESLKKIKPYISVE